MQEKNKKN